MPKSVELVTLHFECLQTFTVPGFWQLSIHMREWFNGTKNSLTVNSNRNQRYSTTFFYKMYTKIRNMIEKSSTDIIRASNKWVDRDFSKKAINSHQVIKISLIEARLICYRSQSTVAKYTCWYQTKMIIRSFYQQ